MIITRRIAAAALLAIACSAASAGVWIEMSRNDDYAAYADPSTIRREGDLVKMWSMFDYKNLQPGPGGKPYLSTRRHFEYDCKQRRARALGASVHAVKAGNGEALIATDARLGWSKVAPDSADDFLLKFACRTESGRPTIYGK
jgi:hypothetical protein